MRGPPFAPDLAAKAFPDLPDLIAALRPALLAAAETLFFADLAD